MSTLFKTTASLLIIAAMAHSTSAHAFGEQGGIEIDNFKANVKTGPVTQLTLGNKNNSELLIASASGKVKMKNFESNVKTGPVTQLTLGNSNTSSLLIGSASSH